MNAQGARRRWATSKRRSAMHDILFSERPIPLYAQVVCLGQHPLWGVDPPRSGRAPEFHLGESIASTARTFRTGEVIGRSARISSNNFSGAECSWSTADMRADLPITSP